MQSMVNTERYTLRAAVYLLLIKEGKILLARRTNTSWRNGQYSLIAGHLDPDESIQTAMIRESKEEAGITIVSSDLKFVHVMHHVEQEAYLDFFFTADSWKGEPHICEPEKCDDMQWFDLDALPENLVPNVREVITQYMQDKYFSEFGVT